MTYASYFNPDILITRDYWAITMICNSESSGRPAISSGGSHAMLVLEKVKKTGEFFRQVIHLVGPGAHKEPKNGVAFLGCPFYAIHNRVGDVLFLKDGKHIQDARYTHKSETWLRAADKVRVMRREAKLERDNPTIYPRPFSIFGDRSVLTKDLETFKITDPFIAAFAYCDKLLFLKFFDRVQKCRDGLSPGIERLHERYFNPLEDNDLYACGDHADGGYNVAKVSTFAVWKSWQRVGNVVDNIGNWFGPEFLGRERNLRLRNNISEERAVEIANLFAHSETPQNREKLIQSAPDHEKKFFVTVKARFEQQLKDLNAYILSDFKSVKLKIVSTYPALNERVQDFMNVCEKDALRACRQIMWLIHEHASLCRITPDSCFTWAREKLLLVDVELTDVGTERLLSPTKMYLKKAGDTEHFVYKNKSNQKFILSFKFKGADITIEAKFVESVKDAARAVVDPLLKDFSFELLSEYDSRFKIFVHINNKEFDQADQIFQKHLLFFQGCFQLGTLVQLIIAQNNPEYIKYFDQKGLSFKYSGGDALWFAFQEKTVKAFEALLKTSHMDLRITDPKGRTHLQALLEESSVKERSNYNQVIKTFCQEFKRRYPESYEDFLNQKVSAEHPFDALDIAVEHGCRQGAEFLIEEGADFEEKIGYWLEGLWSDRYIYETPEFDGDRVSTDYSESGSFSFIRKVMSWDFERQISPKLKIRLLQGCCTFFHAKGKRNYLTPPRSFMEEAHSLIKRHILPYPKKSFRDSDNNGPLMMVLKNCHNVITSSYSPELENMGRSLRIKLLKLLLSGPYPDDINQANKEGETPLMYAAKYDYDLLLFFIQKRRCGVNQQDLQGNTALHHAIAVGGKRRRDALIAHKNINPNIRNRLGQTPLHLTWDRSVIQSLLQVGADISIRDNEGRTPRDVHEQNDIRLRARKLLGF